MSAVSVSESGVRPILAEAVDLARRALLELQPTGVGEHLGVTGENECAATHHFAATLPGYRGWQWEVVVAAAPDAEYATVSESALLPGPDALVAPDFVPWDQRIRPGDLAPGDLLAPHVDDPRLVPGYLETGDPVVDEVCEEIGLGRRQVLSREGRVEAAERWYSEFGPDTEMARSAPGTCGVCGFFVPLAGALRAAFGVCANAMGADGRVVHVEYGCGAHSDTEMPTGAGSPLYEAYDDAAIEVVPAEELTARDGSAESEQSSAAARSDAQDSAGDAADSAAAIAVDAGEPSSADPETEKGAPAGTDTPAASTAVGEGAAETETPSSPAGDAHGVGDTGTAADAPTDTDAAAPERPGTDPAPKGVAAEGVRSGVDSPSTTVDDVSATADSAAPDADHARASDTVPAGGTAGVAPAADDAPAEAAALSAAADTTNTAADAVTGETAPAAESGAAGAEPVRYSDAWAVSAVRVQPGESGAAEEN
ncbi:DUF3027 domain-containing protein [Nocardia cerradoensis]|uniref:DUF3027 domain-containing protein n=1 Tax=Nocardia cerradoensis TaxID=85688 RepID=UPI000A0662EF|nr:DUF3027 domain-containing protein [Nocardia cerradoensis]NKY47330.1 DUF3027 domain-containing protein [Nocardia cerradoensis]